ncbi:hypothetical protein [Porphyrobacter sp. HT-58-2]|uniref:hypothetical protein n=1 Tax=Porphyrobacter sp. HT-58-2 TaxID=2023229 RepID=UPI0011AFE0DF|nr:hypothetical protein [Porphyrobacter sp. HT-58-2]
MKDIRAQWYPSEAMPAFGAKGIDIAMQESSPFATRINAFSIFLTKKGVFGGEKITRNSSERLYPSRQARYQARRIGRSRC